MSRARPGGWSGEAAAGAVRRLRPPSAGRTVIGLVLVSALAAILVARVHGPDGPWLWNLDLPKIGYPLASFFHDALAGGRLPLWNDHLGLGYPLYAEGQIGAFYPPNWLLFQLPPLTALDASRVLHLALAGTGAGVLVLRLAGTRSGALAAALVAVLGGAIAAKLEWHNLVAAYGWMPWVLVPLIRRPHPTRAGLAAAGLMFGVQALTGHPNTWLLTGLAGAVLLLATAPRPATLARIAGFGLLGGAVGAVQLIPTAILTTLSVRNQALSENDLFTSAATPFDVLTLAFQNAFVRTSGGAWDLPTTWYPDGSFALFEAAAYVGLPALALAAYGITARRVRPLVVVAIVCLAIPIVAALRPDPWTAIPILNGLRSPVRSYMVVCLVIAILAGVGIGRLGRSPGGVRRAAAAVLVPVAAYGVVVGLASSLPGVFDALLLASSTFLGEADVARHRQLALDALTVPWPLVLELLAGAAAIVLVGRASSRAAVRLAVAPLALIVAAAPLVILGPLPNGPRPLSEFSYAGTDYVRAVAAVEPSRFFALDPPGWYEGMPDQLAAARIRDTRMFSSLDLRASDDLVNRLAHGDPDGVLRRAVGVDVLASFAVECPGSPLIDVPANGARICRDDAALRPPYWLPADAVTTSDAPGSPIRPREADIDAARAVAEAVAGTPSRRDEGVLEVAIDAPADGWVWIDRAWWPAWQASVDGTPVEARRALGGQLVPVAAGSRVVRQEFVPWDAIGGLGAGVVATLVALGWVALGERRFSPWARRRP